MKPPKDIRHKMDGNANVLPNKVVKTIALLPHERASIEKKLQRTVILQQVDRSYYAALEDIRGQTTISMVVEPSFYGRHQSIAIIVIATANNTYIFDIQALGDIYNSLRVLFEAERPLKILHYGNRVCDQLFYRNSKILLNKICDTFVLLCLAHQNDTPCSLPDAISLVLDVPKEEIHCNELLGPTEAARLFQERPLSNSQINYLAKLAIYQYKLHDRLLYSYICNNRY